MDFAIEINGIDVKAYYTEDNINHIFIPLLRRLTKLQKDKGGRLLVLMAAPPGTGKSTLGAFLAHLSGITEGVTPIQVIGMDGFHRYQEYLVSHTTMCDGEEIPMVKIKGAPVTFDLELLKERIHRVAKGERCGWPEYNRLTHNPQENALEVTGEIVLLEGNYLLLDCDGWRDIKAEADYSILITAAEEDLKARLVERKINSGASVEDANAFVEYSDLRNVRTVLKLSRKGDLNLRLLPDNSYEKVPERTGYFGEPEVADCGCIYG